MLIPFHTQHRSKGLSFFAKVSKDVLPVQRGNVVVENIDFLHWILCALIAQLFPPLLALLGPAMIFLGFAGFMVLQLAWVVGMMPETKQVPLEEMQKKLGITG